MGMVRRAVAGLACVAAVAMLALALSPSPPQAPQELAGVAQGNFLSTLLRRRLALLGKAAAHIKDSMQGSKQLLVHKWWECGRIACDEVPRTCGCDVLYVQDKNHKMAEQHGEAVAREQRNFFLRKAAMLREQEAVEETQEQEATEGKPKL